MKRIMIAPGSELDVALEDAEAVGETLELKRGDRLYRVEPLEGAEAISDAERSRRSGLKARIFELRSRQQPLGITTAQLIREMRAETYGE